MPLPEVPSTSPVAGSSTAATAFSHRHHARTSIDLSSSQLTITPDRFAGSAEVLSPGDLGSTQQDAATITRAGLRDPHVTSENASMVSDLARGDGTELDEEEQVAMQARDFIVGESDHEPDLDAVAQLPARYLNLVLHAAAKTGETAPDLFWENTGVALQLLCRLPADKAQDATVGFLRAIQLPSALLPHEAEAGVPEEYEAQKWIVWENCVSYLYADVLGTLMELYEETRNGEAWLTGFKAVVDFLDEVKRQHPEFGHKLWEELDEAVDQHWLGEERPEMLRYLRNALDADPDALPYRHFRGPPSVSSMASGPTDARLGRAWQAARARGGDADAYSLSAIASPQPKRIGLRPPQVSEPNRSVSSAAGPALPDIAVQSPSEPSVAGSGASRLSRPPLPDGSRRGGLLSAPNSAAASSPRPSQWGGSPARSVPAEASNVRAPSRASDIFDRFWRNLSRNISRESSLRSVRGHNSGPATRNASRATSTSDLSANNSPRRRPLGHSQINPLAYQLLQNFLRDSEAAAAAAREGPTSSADLHGVEWPQPEGAS